ncbi:hypothetical protein I3843_06G055800 [Carya illinoinensis]|uniref:LysM domain-containing protein n=1 Tax=Carya illinoinensis TaxID=32201 RepID=A0A8T1Q8D3_CARIL|nr:uncharacterized protein LOC122312365 [Carya illinoinensis]KAG2701780.1 hypothetical protein I3760_06G059900 [Carya illinoinensis]KAG6650700.1 hypothetical protein CIPAW_06G060500 [Carya illinoinensis]KAG6708035.1 hypothetical protein I3842_06G060000 [Carya illinoinensis]KAG7974601.1 hypothetical protein I3843_06G055800 [Carya illinoinensis]
MERERRNGSHNYNSFTVRCNGGSRDRDIESLPFASPPSALSSGGAVGYIEHTVSKLDTLAGIAIKYGVEVADIKKMNGLVTDFQMFALKSLQIPLPGRHPPSPCLSNGSITPGQSSSDHIPPWRRHGDFFESFQSLGVKSPQRKVSPSISSLQGYNGLKLRGQKTMPECLEMAAYKRGDSQYLEDGPFPSASLVSNQSLSHHRKSKSLVNALLDENGELAATLSVSEAQNDTDKCCEKMLRRRQKSEADFTHHTPEMLLENNSNTGGFLAKTGKGLALRPKAASRTTTSDSEAGGLNPIPIGLGDSVVSDDFSGVKKSSSTSSLQDQDYSSASSIWTTTRWSLKPDLQALSTAAIAKPIFDGLPKPTPGRRNKAALD